MRGGGVAALFKDVYQCKQVSFGQYLSFEYLGIMLKVLHAYCLSLFTGLQITLQPLLKSSQNCNQ